MNQRGAAAGVLWFSCGFQVEFFTIPYIPGGGNVNGIRFGRLYDVADAAFCIACAGSAFGIDTDRDHMLYAAVMNEWIYAGSNNTEV